MLLCPCPQCTTVGLLRQAFTWLRVTGTNASSLPRHHYGRGVGDAKTAAFSARVLRTAAKQKTPRTKTVPDVSGVRLFDFLENGNRYSERLAFFFCQSRRRCSASFGSRFSTAHALSSSAFLSRNFANFPKPISVQPLGK